MPYMPSEAEATLEVTGPETPWWEQEYFGIPLWIWLLGGVGGAIAIGAIAYEMRREEMMMMAMMR